MGGPYSNAQEKHHLGLDREGGRGGAARQAGKRAGGGRRGRHREGGGSRGGETYEA